MNAPLERPFSATFGHRIRGPALSKAQDCTDVKYSPQIKSGTQKLFFPQAARL
jgi:hypothetical protein